MVAQVVAYWTSDRKDPGSNPIESGPHFSFLFNPSKKLLAFTIALIVAKFMHSFKLTISDSIIAKDS